MSTSHQQRMTMRERIWVNEARTILITIWDNGIVEVALRDDHPIHGGHHQDERG